MECTCRSDRQTCVKMYIYFMHAWKIFYSYIKYVFLELILFFKLMVEVNFSNWNFPCNLFFFVSLAIVILELYQDKLIHQNVARRGRGFNFLNTMGHSSLEREITVVNWCHFLYCWVFHVTEKYIVIHSSTRFALG